VLLVCLTYCSPFPTETAVVHPIPVATIQPSNDPSATLRTGPTIQRSFGYAQDRSNDATIQPTNTLWVPTRHLTPTALPTDTPTATATPTATFTPTPAGYHPIIDPRLVPAVPDALARLKSCSPEGYALVSQYATEFRFIEGNISHSATGHQTYVEIAEFFLNPGKSPDTDEFYLMLVIVHEARHNWLVLASLEDWTLLHLDRETEAYTYMVRILDQCAPTAQRPDEIAQIRAILVARAANPPTAP